MNSTQTTRRESTQSVDALNIALIILSVLIAAYLPFETFVMAYAVLGPLHYLTEISWLHDRSYFSARRYDWAFLLIPIPAILFALVAPFEYNREVTTTLLSLCFFGAAGLAFFPDQKRRTIALLVGLAYATVALYLDSLALLVLVLLPTLIHVYLFTGLFIVFGAMKSQSRVGYLSAVAFLAAPAVCIWGVSTPVAYAPSDYFLDAASPFAELTELLKRLFQLPAGIDGSIAVMRLLAFAYTYHYLNWFSKTKIINWHTMSAQRLRILATAYVASVGLYAIDYSLGFLALFALSLAHVVLEFPLNHRTIVGLVGELKKRM